MNVSLCSKTLTTNIYDDSVNSSVGVCWLKYLKSGWLCSVSASPPSELQRYLLMEPGWQGVGQHCLLSAEREKKHHNKALLSDRCVCVFRGTTDRFQLDSLSDLVQKSVSACAGHWSFFLLHLLQVGALSDLTQERRLSRGTAVSAVSLHGQRRSRWRRTRRWWRRRWRGRCSSA